MAFIERFDAAATVWPWPARWLYLGVKWFLVLLGAYLMVRVFQDRWGWGGVIVFLVMPALEGLRQWAQGPE